jgi:hypothetical protein
VGDGVQAVSLGMLGGTWTNNAGILIQTNVTVSGNGLLTGGSGGVSFNNGSTLIPGAAGSATNTMGTVLLGDSTWTGGMTLELNVTNVAGTNGSGWDLVRVVGSLNFVPAGGKMKIKLDSLGETVGGFNAANSTFINLVDFSSFSSFTTNDIEVDTNKFLIGQNWFLQVTATDIRYVYQRPTPAIYVSTSGNNGGGTNWTTAYTTLSNALPNVQNYDTVYVAGQTFTVATAVALSSRVGVSIYGGYQAVSDAVLPGANDPIVWPTIFKPIGNGVPVMTLSGITNGYMKDITITGGATNPPVAGGRCMGLSLTKCIGLTIDSCIITNNKQNGSGQSPYGGGGVYASQSTFTMTNCLVSNNVAGANQNGYDSGGGVYMSSCVMTMTLCRVIGNTASGSGSQGGAGYGGGLYLASGTSVITRTVISRNTAANQGCHGGGILNAGRLLLLNCIVDRNNDANDTADGIEAGGNTTIMNCTVADNYGVGILYVGGAIAVSNSIVWGHSDDLKSFPNDGQDPLTLSNVFYSCIEDTDNDGRQNCISLNPLFTSTTNYHLQSVQGYYSNGYFSGGTWGATSLSNSPCIDIGSPLSDYTNEPAPRGSAINLGAYGNTPVASLTDITTLFAPPTITNLGATLVGHRTVRLNGQVTSTGGQSPLCWAQYWITGESVTSTASAGIKSDVFDLDVGSLTPGAAYEYYFVASNSAGVVASDVKTFSTHPVPDALYVSTNGANSAGISWSTAYTNPQTAFDMCEPGDTIYLAGQTFVGTPGYQQSSVWTLQSSSNLTVIGGYAATNDTELPGTNNFALWPTALRRTSGDARVIYVNGLTNSLIRNVMMRDGYVSSQAISWTGLGMYMASCRGITLDSCIFSNNVINAYATAGGLYITASGVVLTNCLITKNSALAGGNSAGTCGGIYMNSGSMTMVLCRVTGNTSTGSGSFSGSASGGGIVLAAGSTNFISKTVIRANSTEAAGGGIKNSAVLILKNSLIDHNDSTLNNSDGIISGGNMSILNCTVADNGGGVGILYAGGTIGLTNSIVWGHSDDIKTFPNDQQPTPTVSNVFYCTIQGSDNNGVQECIDSDPLFVNTNYYHLQSKAGYYSGGFFSGGSWAQALSNSPAIDRGNPDSDYTNEPAPRGSAINMGAYGNTEVASQTENVMANPPVVTNRGAIVWGHRTVRLTGEVLDTGGEIPDTGFRYWIVGDSVTSSVSAGLQSAGFDKDLTGLTPGSDYQFIAYAVNSATQVVSDVKDFSTRANPSSLYVSTNGNNTAGTNWTTSYTNLQEVLDRVESNDTVYLAGHTFGRQTGFGENNLWVWQGDSGVKIIGGYAATNDAILPGAHDSAQWPTVLKRTNGTARILYLGGLTNCTLQDVTIRDGYIPSQFVVWQGIGMYVGGCRGLTLDSCLFTNNVAYAYPSGGGLYVNLSSILLTNCLFTKNSSAGVGNGYGTGGGITMNSGSMTMVLCRVTANTASGSGSGSTLAYGGGLALVAGSTNVIIRSVISANGVYASGAGIDNRGVLLLQNSIIDHNNSTSDNSDGLYSDNRLTILNCTVANNSGVGVRQAGGTVAITNSILWNNVDDLTGTVAVAYSDIQTTDSFWTNDVNGCISVDPLFVNTIYYHIPSQAGYYVGGYFSGGSWDTSASDSPCIDAGDPASPYGLEPVPNGKRVNLGAYGNTEVASKKLTPTGSIFSIY